MHRALWGHRADIYALGCVAYWLLTGRVVFSAPSAVLTLLRHIEEEPDPPSLYAPHPISPELDAVVLACLAKQPEDRPADAAALARRLAACPTREPWTEERAQEWWRTHLSPDPACTSGPTVAPRSEPVAALR